MKKRIHRSRLCKADMHSWCFNRNADETHCKCKCHRPKTGYVWVLRDLSNGDNGQTYAWFWMTRNDARAQRKEHEIHGHAKLSAPQKWVLSDFFKHFRPISGCVKFNYCRRMM